MVITPTWQQPKFLADGFMAFDKTCAENLATLIDALHAKNQSVEIVMTSTHRIHHESNEWQILLNNRGIFPDSVSIVNKVTSFAEIGKRIDEVLEWVRGNPNQDFIILDDDKSLRELPPPLKSHWIECQFLTGFNEDCLQQALSILNGF